LAGIGIQPVRTTHGGLDITHGPRIAGQFGQDLTIITAITITVIGTGKLPLPLGHREVRQPLLQSPNGLSMAYVFSETGLRPIQIA
jgi:hypothetical protein